MKTGFKSIGKFKTEDIHMRDPFVFLDNKRGKYFLFGTTLADGCGDKEPIFEVYVGEDLKIWEGPYIAFEPKKGFWGVRHFWAPEVFEYNGRYYMFASFKGGIGEHRGTGILVSDSPEGPYVDHSKKAVTPEEWECLDGTLHIEDGEPWMVFCHEWTQEYNGKIKARKLTKDLKESTGEIIEILDAKSIKWIRKFGDPRIEKDGYLTDAPFMYKTKNGRLIMLWSSYSYPNYMGGDGGYTVAMAYSKTGNITGPWENDDKLLLDCNCGHPSIFRDLDNNLILCVHGPDTPHGSERPVFIEIEEKNDNLVLKK